MNRAHDKVRIRIPTLFHPQKITLPQKVLIASQYGEHPEERAVDNKEVIEKLGDVETLTNIFSNLKSKVRAAWKKTLFS